VIAAAAVAVCALALAGFLLGLFGGRGGTHELRVLLYHNIISGEGGDENNTPLADFKRDMQTLSEGGYHPVSVADLEAYVGQGAELPENAVLIRFDDGYLSNYELAYPVLKEYGYKAVIFAIGVSVGHTTYKDTQTPIIPHFTYEQAREMTESGLIEVQSHTYDMHQVKPLDGENCRQGILPMDGESDADYAETLRADFAHSRAELESATGQAVTALAYPYGLHGELTEDVLKQAGVTVTFIIEKGVNTLTEGVPQSLYNLKVSTVGSLAQG
jgi:peptidoglycan/xylan/chitin deacetylase (PgdA/CDA1 family)